MLWVTSQQAALLEEIKKNFPSVCKWNVAFRKESLNGMLAVC